MKNSAPGHDIVTNPVLKYHDQQVRRLLRFTPQSNARADGLPAVQEERKVATVPERRQAVKLGKRTTTNYANTDYRQAAREALPRTNKRPGGPKCSGRPSARVHRPQINVDSNSLKLKTLKP